MRDERLRQSELWPGWLDENQRREATFEAWRDQAEQQAGESRSESLAQDSQQHLMLQRMAYQDWLEQQQQEDVALSGGLSQGLDRHDFYHLDTAHELEEAMERAAVQGIDYTNAEKFQQFLEQEAQQGVHQIEGKRSLSHRFQDLTQQSKEVADLTERGARPEQIPTVQLYESAQEQTFRLEQERNLIREPEQQQSPAREKLAQIRQEHGLNDREREPEQQRQKSWGRGR